MNCYVLTNFEPYYLSPPILQKTLVEQAIAVKTLAIAMREKLTHESDIENLRKIIDEKFVRFSIKPEYIYQRRIFFNTREQDFLGLDKPEIPLENSIYKDFICHGTHLEGINVSERMEIFDQIISKVFSEMYQQVCRPPNNIIHVSSVGYVLPSPAQRLVSNKAWANTTVTHCYHTGCHAAIPAIKAAVGDLASSISLMNKPKNHIDIIHTELASIHANLLSDSPLRIILGTLFGDGFIKYSVKREAELSLNEMGLKTLTLDEKILPDSLDGISWKIDSHRFKMSLSLHVPSHIEKHILSFVSKLCENIGIAYDANTQDDFLYAIHPGGPKIIDNIANALNLSYKQMKYSVDVLYNNGNMSSAALPFVLKSILENPSVTPGKKIIAMTFGPGLTAAGGIFEKIVR